MRDTARPGAPGTLQLRLVVLFALLLFVVAPRAFAASTTVSWGPNTEPYLTGYKVHYGLGSRTYQSHLDVGKSLSRTVSGLVAGKTYYFAVTAYDRFGNESGYSQEVALTVPGGVVETISTPAAPSGPVAGATGVAYTYTAKGAASSSGDPVQYRFSWSDGSVSDWLAPGVATAAKAWGAAGEYDSVLVEARCSRHPSVVSKPSPALKVSITGAPVETITAPSKPNGPTAGVVGTTYTYTTGGSVSSSGDPVQYRFSWSDGSVSDWLPAASAFASKAWGIAGTYTLVRVQARCAIHQSVVSVPSPSITVTIAPGVAETVSAPSVPAGPAGGTAGTAYEFSSGGAVSGSGHTVRHRFHWGDGTVSDWIGPAQPVTAWKSWTTPGTYLVRAEASCVAHPTVGAFSPAFEVAIAAADPLPVTAAVLWTRGDTGQAVLSTVDATAPPGSVSVLDSAYLQPDAGMGAPWRATGYSPVDATSGYALWTRGDLGQAELWKVDPSVGGTIPMLGAVTLYAPRGEGGPWEATDYAHVDAATGFVLWSRSDTGQAELWRIDTGAGSPTILGSAALQSSGGPWQATSYAHVDASTGYVLWTRGDTGQASLWKVDPGAEGVMTAIGSIDFSPPSEGPWTATGYTQVDASTGYLLWSRSDTGQTVLWKIDPSLGGAAIVGSADLAPPVGGGPWHATDYAR